MLKNTYLVLLVVVFMVFATLAEAETTGDSSQESVLLTAPSRGKPLTLEQADFLKRTAAAHQFWNNYLSLISEFIKELGLREDRNQGLESAVEALRENSLFILTLVKYFSVTELDKFVELSNSSEVHSMVNKIGKKIVDVHFQHDIASLIYEVRMALKRAKKQLGKPTEEILPIPRLQQSSIFTDKGEVVKRLLAARQLLTSCLPLIEEIVRRQFNLEFQAIEGSRVSIAVNSVVESLRENPVVMSILAQHFEAIDLNKIADFLDTIEVRNSVATVSRLLFVGENGQFQLDVEHVRREMEKLSTGIMGSLSEKIPLFTTEEKSTQGKKESGSEGQKASNINPAKKVNGLEKLKILLPLEATKKDKVAGEGDKTGLESGKQEGITTEKGDGGKPEKSKGEKKPKKGKEAGKEAGKTSPEKSTAPLPGKAIKKGQPNEAGAKTGQAESPRQQE